ncbi:hypothetical protein T440DRAFT_271424 [Plenodomus tracheiphilus IPT5]|uniref:Wax synthase domain-containing protein n=1 Tax=Plenodomus tracheiphilus IPT5 TaxID=1408161 RepID=A0A6A7BFW7_9PLEO|nr:hypothetical protein T440DRAFT_271424 [Plenodomus tracheiphilus IPT5]
MLFSKSGSWPRSHYDLLEHYYAQYDKQIASGEYRPFLYPWGTFGALVAIIYLLIPHQNRPWLRNCRYPVFVWITGFAIYTILYTRARLVAASFGIGLISAWSVAWICAILICNDAQTDFMRIERMEGAFGAPRITSKEKTSANREESSSRNATKRDNGNSSISISKGTAGPSDRHGQFAWQPYPLSPFIERLDWVLDIFCNFRGAGWNWRTSALPPPPKWLQTQLHQNSTSPIPKHSTKLHASQVKSYPTRTALLTANTKTLLKGYLLLDALKTLMMWDPYFWGLVNRPPPPSFPTLITNNPRITHIYRLTLSMLAVKTALQTIFALGPLFFSGLLGPQRLGARAEAFMYPETWASFTVVLDRGLAGWWSSWWHQTFRFALEQPSRRFIEVLGMESKGVAAKVVQLLVAFGMSGVLHASGSWTIAGETSPLRGSLAFFLWQAVGIFVEGCVVQGIKGMGVGQRVPRWAKRLFTFVYVHVWFYFTAHLLCDDFTRGGIWLFEPVPVSLLRGMGFGADERDGWWCWNGQLLRWHSGDRWWNSGIAF